MLLGGRAAEIEILGTMTAGASDDIKRASNIARKMVGELGMSELGCICVTEESGQTHSAALMDKVEETARKLVEAQLDRARNLVRADRACIDQLVTNLLEHDTLEAPEIRECFGLPRERASAAAN